MPSNTSSHSSRLLGPTTLQTMPVGFLRDTLSAAGDRTEGTRPARPLRRRADQRIHPIAPSTIRRVRSRESEGREDALVDDAPRLRLRADSMPVATDGPLRKRSRRPLDTSPTSSLPIATGSNAAYARAERSLAKATARRENESRTMALAKGPTRPTIMDNSEERVALDKARPVALVRTRAILVPTKLEENSDEEAPTYSGPLATAEFERIKVEMERLKQELETAKDIMSKQAKTIEKLEKDKADQSTQVNTLKDKVAKSDELFSTFESNLQCQICLDPFLQPYALAPCGHVYCLSCLQDWFRNAPPAEEDMYDSDTVHALVHRRKTCPTCRGWVRSRPAPLFIVKALSAAVAARNGTASPVVSVVPTAREVSGAEGELAPEDPWANIFYAERGADDVSSDSYSSDEDDEDDGQFVVSEDEDEVVGAWGAEYGYGTGSDEEPEEGPYVLRRWEPPTVPVDLNAPDLQESSGETRSLLARGVVMPMISTFSMHYTHTEGLSLVRGTTTFFPGWTLSLHPADLNGAEYVEWLVRDLAERPERWAVERLPRGRVIARRLVKRGEVEEYDTTDSEAYVEV